MSVDNVIIVLPSGNKWCAPLFYTTSEPSDDLIRQKIDQAEKFDTPREAADSMESALSYAGLTYAPEARTFQDAYDAAFHYARGWLHACGHIGEKFTAFAKHFAQGYAMRRVGTLDLEQSWLLEYARAEFS